MRKISFNEHLGHTKAVLEGRKTMFRRAEFCLKALMESSPGVELTLLPFDKQKASFFAERRFRGWLTNVARMTPYYKIGEVLAVAQPYRDIVSDPLAVAEGLAEIAKNNVGARGWNESHCVPAIHLPHQIRITDVRLERLGDISDEDCFAEGIEKCDGGYKAFEMGRQAWIAGTPQEAFGLMFDKDFHKRVFRENLYVFVYPFELVK